ncbi:MAG: NAD(P)H-dependent glycerol-3-phosphate dehydrogenase, partial [Nitratireductor sp.]
DLVLTCSSPQSRNFSYGLALGKNQDLSTLPLAEGAFSATITNKIAIENGINCPIIAAVAKLVTGEVNPNEAVQQLLNRPLKPEIEAEN